MENNNGFLYKIRYTGWGRILVFLLIILITGGSGYGIYSVQPKRTEENILNDYKSKKLSNNITDAIMHNDRESNKIISFGVNYNYSNGKNEFNSSNSGIKNLDNIEEKDGNLVFLKGSYDKEGVKLEKNNLDDDYITAEMEDKLNTVFGEKKISNEESESINSDDEDYIEKMRTAESFSVESDPDYRYSKGEYGTFDGGMSIAEAKEEYGEDGIYDTEHSIDGPIGYIYPKGKVTIYETEDYNLEIAEFAISINKDDILNNLYYTNNLEDVIITGFLPALAIGILLLLIFNGFSEYENMKEVKYIQIIDKWFIDIILVILFVIFGMGITIVDDVLYAFSTQSMAGNYKITIGVITAVSIFTLILFSYLLLVFKGIFNNGIVNTIKNKTLTFWLIKKTIKYTKVFIDYISRKIHNIATDVGTLGTMQIALIVVGMALVVIFFSFIFRTGAEGMWFLLGIIAMVVAYRIIYSIVKNIRNLNEKSSEIAKGNYDVKVNEDLPYFKNIAHNFNTIGDNLTTAVEEQVKAERMRTELITNVSHDLKTPLTSIINYSKILIDDEASTEEKLEYAEIIHEKSLKLKTLIEDLFQISKATSNNIEFEKEKLDFSSLTLQAIGEWKDNFEEKGLNIIFTKPEYPIVLELDGNRTYRVLDNLMSNIYKYAQGNTRVYMDLKEKEEGIELTIKNISAYELNISAEELMERFTRGDKSRTTDGSGLGLSIASSLVEGQGGIFNIEIDGDLFKVTIRF